jgi:Abnormal spindle-like microcephaly-assoc'd, ASPM-SPD-2-Hydin/Beta-propeller repeat
MKIHGSAIKIKTLSIIAALACIATLAVGLRGLRDSSQHLASRGAQSEQHNLSPTVSSADRARTLDAYSKLPLGFTENQGQSAQEVRYVSHGGQYDLFLTSQEAVLALRHTQRLNMSPRYRAKSLHAMNLARKAATTTTALRLQFEGANPAPQIAGSENLPGKVNYYIGNDPGKWHVGLPTFAQVKYSQLYPGIALVFYGNQRQLEYDFVVSPGADPNLIRLKLSGARKLRAAANGNVVVSVKDGQIELRKPVVYQNINGRRQEIAANYSLRGERVSFDLARYDRSAPLIIDPIVSYSTYLGGNGDNDAAFAMAVDTAGDAFLGGETDSTDFPIMGLGVTTTTPAGFVSELNPTGTALIASTYLGGTAGGDMVDGLALDPTGNVYVTGVTFATDFPTTSNALKPTLSANPNGTTFLAKSNVAGTIQYSTYLGGNGNNGFGDFANAVAADANGNAYVTGITYSDPGSTDITFPVMNAFTATLPSSAGSAFLTRIDTTKLNGASLIYSTYLGGDGANAVNADQGFADAGFGVAVDTSGKAYIAGSTTSSDFPTAGSPFQSSLNINNNWSEAFLSEIDTTKSGGASLVYSTYLGGSGDATAGLGDIGFAVDLRSGTTTAYVTGGTNSADFPTTSGAFQTAADTANGSGFVTLINTAAGSSLVYSTFLGGTPSGNGATTGNAIKVDTTSGNAVVVGTSGSTNLPVTPGAVQKSLAASAIGDAFIGEIKPAGAGAADLIYLSYFGGSGTSQIPDEGFAVALGTLPTVYIAGQTLSSNFPATASAFQTTLKGAQDAFAAKLTLQSGLTVSATALTFTSPAIGTPTAGQSVTLTNTSNVPITFTSATITNPTPPAAATDFAHTTTCGASIASGATCIVTVIFTPSATTETATLTLTDGDPTSPQSVALTGNVVAAFTVAPTSLSFTSNAVGTAAGAQTVTLTNNTGTAIPFTSATIVAGAPPASATDFTATVTPACVSVPANGTCTVSVNYTPSVATTETATLVLTDGGVGSPQMVALTGNVTAAPPDFTISAAPTSFNVARGATGTSTITITAVGDFDSAVTLACSGAPAKSTCTIAPTSVTPVSAAIARKGAVRHADGDQATATLSFATTRHGEVAPPVSLRFPPFVPRVVVPVFLTLFAMLFFFVSDQRLRGRLATAAVVLFLVVLAGCGSSGGTRKGTYTLTVTGTAGSITHTTTVTATVTN